MTARLAREDELRFRSAIAEHMAEAVILSDAADGEILYANRTAGVMFGYLPDELVGEPIAKLSAPIDRPPPARLAEVEADDGARTVEYRLTAPQADFLHVLATPFAAPTPAAPADDCAAAVVYLASPAARKSATLASPGFAGLDQQAREVRRNGELIDLTPKEFTVLEYLMRHAGRVMSRTLITEYAWGYHFDPGTNIVDVVINHVRKKVDAKHDRKLITTVRGVGYVVKG